MFINKYVTINKHLITCPCRDNSKAKKHAQE